MILIARGQGRPDRIAHVQCIGIPAPLDRVAEAIAEYARSGGRTVYVERSGDRFRWSPAVRGGGYPLLRVVARFLECPHTDITVGVEPVGEWCIVQAAGLHSIDGYVVLDDIDEAPHAVREQIAQHFPAPVDVEIGREGPHRD